MKNVLITGSSLGIGKTCAFFFAKKKYNLYLTYYTNKDKCLELKDELVNKYHINVECYYLDLCNEDSIVNMYNDLAKKNVNINILINNSALSLDNEFELKTKDEFMKVLETNVVGTFLVTKYISKLMNNDDYIFNISSTDAIDTYSDLNIDYSASKAAINNMTLSLSGIIKPKIIALCPNWVNTDTIREMNQDYLKKEMERVGQKELIDPEEIPKKIDNLINNNTDSGKIIRIDGDNHE